MVAPALNLPAPGQPHALAVRSPWATVVLAVAALHLALVLVLSHRAPLTAPTPLPSGEPMAVTWLSTATMPSPSPAAPPPVAPRQATRLNPEPPRPVPVAQNTSPPAPVPALAAQPAQAALSGPSATPIAHAPPVAAPSAAAAATPAPPPAPRVSAPSNVPPSTPPSYDAAYLDNPQPSYPAVSRREGEQGQVLLRVHVLPSGLPDQVEVHTSSGFERLDKAARSAVARWKFTPARSGEHPVAEWVTVPIDFFLKRAQP